MTTWDDPDGFPEPYVEEDDEFDDDEPCTSPKALCSVKYQYNNLNVGDLVISSKSEGGWTLVYHKHPSNSRQISEWVPTTYLTEVRPKEKKPMTSNDDTGMVNTNIIKVSGFPEGTTKQEITSYFENKRKHFVGRIVGIDLNESGTVANITFKDTKSVERVMRKLPLKFGAKETQIHVELIPIDDSPTSSDSEDSEDANSVNRTIEVRNIPESATDHSLQIHFMSSKKSGGGEVESCVIYPNEGFAKVTFEDDEVLDRVLKTRQVFEGQELLLKLFEPAPPAKCYKNKFFVKGINTNIEMMKLLFKVKAGLRATMTEILEGEEDGTALVTCDSDVDIPRLQAAFESDAEHRYKIEPVKITNTIEVRNVRSQITEETLKFYFMLQRESGGGDIEKINEQDGVFYIHFLDPLCVERTCGKNRRHKLGGEILQVTAFYECLHGHDDFVIPTAKEIHDVDPAKIEFLKHTQQQMMKELNENFMKIVWPGEEEDGFLRIECLIKKTQRGYKKLSRQWEKNVMMILQKYLNNIAVDKNDNISSQVWDSVWSDIEQHLMDPASDTYIIIPNKTDLEISIVGAKDSVAEVSRQVRKTIRAKEMEYEKKEDDVTGTMHIESFKIELFQKLGHIEKLKELFPNLKINVMQKQIDFEGPLSKIYEAKLFVHQKLSDIKPAEVGRYSRRFMNFVLNDSVRDYLADKLMSKHITAVLDYDNKKRLMVYSTDDSSAVDAAHLVKEEIVEAESRKVPENSECLLSSQELKHKIDDLNQQYPGLLETSPDYQECSIQIFCVQDIVDSVLEVINEYLTNNILLIQARKKPRGVLRYLCVHRRNEIITLQEDLKRHFVEIDFDETAIYIKGTVTGLARAKLKMEQMIRKIFKKKQVFKNSGIISQINTAQGYENIESVEEGTGCIIEIAAEEDEEEDQSGEQDTNPSPKMWAKCQTASEKNIYCMHGDITLLENVDVIVNAADGFLKMEGGLAKVIKEKGGKEVVDDCKKHISSKGRMYEGDVYVGVPGNLRNQCKSIFHAVGPVYRDGKQKEEDYLREVMFQILEQATSKRYRSIVVPAISTGIYNYPLSEAVKVLVESVSEYFEENSNSTVNDVFFCDIDLDVVTKFGDQLKETFGAGTVIFNKQENKLGGWLDFSKGREPKADRPVVSMVFNGTISVQIVRGNIALQKVDVIVNLTSKDLDLEFDPAELCLLEKGGKDLQRQCQAQYPEGIEENEIALTKGGNLLCKNMFHCYIPQEKTPAMAVNDFTESCIKLAHDERFESIALPPISTGKFNFPAEDIAKGMIECLHKFTQSQSNTTLKDIRVVIPETSLDQLQVYEDSLKEYEASMSRKTDSRRHRTYLGDQQDIPKDSDISRKPLIARPKPIPRSSKNSYSIQNINLEVSKTDLPSAKADALIYIHVRKSSIEGADLTSFQQKAGNDVYQTINAKLSYTSEKKCFPVIKAGDNIPARFIIVVNSNISGREWKSILLKAMQTAEDKGCETIALPGFWKSDERKDLEDAIHKLYDAIVEFQLTDFTFLKSIQLVIKHQSSLSSLLPIIKDTVETRKGKKSGILSKVTSFFGSNDHHGTSRNRNSASANYQAQTKPQTASVTTIFYGDSEEKIDGAIEELVQRFQSDLKVEIFEDDIIKEFSRDQISQIQELDKRHAVEIKIEKRLGRIRVTGMPENVASALEDINRMFRRFATTTYKEREAKQLQQVVQWCYEEDDDEQEYDMFVNHELENAFRQKERQKILRFDKGEEYIFDFEEMVEYPVNDPKKIVRIIRRDARKPNVAGLGTIEYPEGWKAMTNAQNVILVDLDPSEREYKYVFKSFNDTIGQSERKIHKIQRIQNKMIYQQYVAKKDQMRKENKSCNKNERQLWHGTSEGSLSSINKRGLNRSYCGKHATLFGQGIYFAANSDYSTQDTYSPPSPTTGNKYVYFCNVLTGEFKKGTSGMRIPPAKSDTEDSLYDSVVDNEEQPSIFVIFNDTQAYPAFLVTFS